MISGCWIAILLFLVYGNGDRALRTEGAPIIGPSNVADKSGAHRLEEMDVAMDVTASEARSSKVEVPRKTKKGADIKTDVPDGFAYFHNYSALKLGSSIGLQNWTDWAISARKRDPDRSVFLQRKLLAAAGVYRDKSKSLELGLQKTILISVISYSAMDNRAHVGLIRNYFCFCRHYGFHPLVYVLHHDENAPNQRSKRSRGHDSASSSSLDGAVSTGGSRRLQDTVAGGRSVIDTASATTAARTPKSSYLLDHDKFEADVRRSLGISSEDGQIIAYPEALFWDMISKKSNWNNPRRGGFVDFVGNSPSFRHFGALVNFVPLLEVLSSNYGAIYLDIDIAFVRDPIPFLLVGNADIVASPETRHCSKGYFSQPLRSLDTLDWHRIEPNTGILHVRQGKGGLMVVKNWLEALVQANPSNDQRYLDFKAFGSAPLANCAWNYTTGFRPYNQESYSSTLRRAPVKTSYNNNSATVDGDASSGQSATTAGKPLKKKDKRTARSLAPPGVTSGYCILPDLLFQNGHSALRCGLGVKGTSMEEYVLGVDNVAGAIDNFDNDFRSPGTYGYKLHSEASTLTTFKPKRLVAPVSVHFNYVDDKRAAFRDTGFWILNDGDDASGTMKNRTTGTRGSTSSTGTISLVTSAESPSVSMPPLSCKRYDVADTAFGNLRWQFKLDLAREELQRKLAKAEYSTATMLQFDKRAIFIFDARGRVRLIPNLETMKVLMNAFKLTKTDTRNIFDEPIYRSLPRGPDVEDIEVMNVILNNISNPAARRDKKRDMTIEYLETISHRGGFKELYIPKVPPIESLTPNTPEDDADYNCDFLVANIKDSVRWQEQAYRDKVIESSARVYWCQRAYAARAQQPDRGLHLASLLEQRSGVYSDETKRASKRLSKSVLTTVITSLDQFEMLSNWLCALRRFGLTAVVYSLPSLPILNTGNMSSSSTQTTTSFDDRAVRLSNLLKSFHDVVSVISYPTELFWTLIAYKRQWPRWSKGRFDGEIPSLEIFGSWITLVPLLEVVDLGYDVAYLDTDVTMTRDPIPFMTVGEANFNAARKVRHCRDIDLSMDAVRSYAPELSTGNGGGSGNNVNSVVKPETLQRIQMVARSQLFKKLIASTPTAASASVQVMSTAAAVTNNSTGIGANTRAHGTHAHIRGEKGSRGGLGRSNRGGAVRPPEDAAASTVGSKPDVIDTSVLYIRTEGQHILSAIIREHIDSDVEPVNKRHALNSNWYDFPVLQDPRRPLVRDYSCQQAAFQTVNDPSTEHLPESDTTFCFFPDAVFQRRSTLSNCFFAQKDSAPATADPSKSLYILMAYSYFAGRGNNATTRSVGATETDTDIALLNTARLAAGAPGKSQSHKSSLRQRHRGTTKDLSNSAAAATAGGGAGGAGEGDSTGGDAAPATINTSKRNKKSSKRLSLSSRRTLVGEEATSSAVLPTSAAPAAEAGSAAAVSFVPPLLAEATTSSNEQKIQSLITDGFWLGSAASAADTTTSSSLPSAPEAGNMHCRAPTPNLSKKMGTVDNWSQLASASAKYLASLLNIPDGTPVRQTSSKAPHTTYVYTKGVLRPIPDGETVKELGLDKLRLEPLHEQMLLKLLPKGPPIASKHEVVGSSSEVSQ